MAFTETLIILFVSLSSVVLHTHAAAHTPEGRAYSICKSASNPSFCYKTILPLVKGSAQLNFYKILEVEILETHKQVLTTSNLINSLLTKPDMSKDMKESLMICKSQYHSMVSDIKEAFKLVAARDGMEVRFKFSGVLSYQSACDDSFSAGVTSPILNEANAVRDIATICLDISKAIEDREIRLRGGKTVTAPLAGPPPSGPCQKIVGPCN